MLHYIIQTIAFQLFFLIIYDLFLKKETFFNWNRMYILVTAFLSLILPFIKVNSFKEVIPQNYIISLPEVVLGQSNINPNNAINLDAVILENSPISYWEIIFYIGVFIAFSLFLFKVFKIFVLVLKNPKQSIGKIVLVELINSNAAFSFFHYIFLGEHIKTEDKETILKHELIHTQQKHTIDLLFFEVLRVLFWFNPLVYMYQNRMATLHEFIADANAIKHQDKNEYYQNLLGQVFETKKISFINTFFKQSLIKKRIVMLQKSKSRQIKLFKYVLLIPMVLGMLVYTSSEAQEKSNNNNTTTLSVNLTNDEELITKLADEYNELIESGEDYETMHNAFFINSINYILSKEDYYRQKIYFQHLSKNYNGSKSNIHQRTYNEYLKWKKTEEAKEVWESNTLDGNLKLVVNDLNNLSSEEKEKFKKKRALLNKDVFFTKLMMTDIKQSELKIFYRPNEFSSANKRDESKAVLLNEVGIDVGYAVIDQVPVFPGCENMSSEEQRRCMSKNISMYVNRNFNTKLADELKLTGRQRINVVFKIDTEGDVTDIRSRAPHPDLEEEAIRVIKTLPKMIPGKHKGKIVNVPYSLPIIFQIRDEVKNNQSETIPLDEIEVPFAVIENVPVYPGCEDLVSNVQKKECMSEKISEFVAKKFNTTLGDSLGLKGRQRINVIFKIDTEGYIKGIRSRAPHPDLESEAVRVISLLPKMTPGVQHGKAVTVPYSLPIIFQVADDTQMLNEVAITKVTKYRNSDYNIEVPFSVIEQVPVFPGCEGVSNEEQKNCTTNKINSHVNKNFNTKLATELGLKGRQRINVIFKIDKEGHVTGIRSRAPHPDLEAEAVRVIKTLPIMIPGEQKGKKVDVPYNLPIIFQVAD